MNTSKSLDKPNLGPYKTQVRGWLRYWWRRLVLGQTDGWNIKPILIFKMGHIITDPDEIIRAIRQDDTLSIAPPKEWEGTGRALADELKEHHE